MRRRVQERLQERQAQSLPRQEQRSGGFQTSTRPVSDPASRYPGMGSSAAVSVAGEMVPELSACGAGGSGQTCAQQVQEMLHFMRDEFPLRDRRFGKAIDQYRELAFPEEAQEEDVQTSSLANMMKNCIPVSNRARQMFFSSLGYLDSLPITASRLMYGGNDEQIQRRLARPGKVNAASLMWRVYLVLRFYELSPPPALVQENTPNPDRVWCDMVYQFLMGTYRPAHQEAHVLSPHEEEVWREHRLVSPNRLPLDSGTMDSWSLGAQRQFLETRNQAPLVQTLYFGQKHPPSTALEQTPYYIPKRRTFRPQEISPTVLPQLPESLEPTGPLTRDQLRLLLSQRELVITDVAMCMAQLRQAYPIEDTQVLLRNPEPWNLQPQLPWRPSPEEYLLPVPFRPLAGAPDSTPFDFEHPEPDIFRVLNVNLLGTDPQEGWVRSEWVDCRSALVQLYSERNSTLARRREYVEEPESLVLQ